MKSRFIYIGLFLAICTSMYFMYERSFITRDFELINSEEVSEEEEAAPEEESLSQDLEATEVESNETTE